MLYVALAQTAVIGFLVWCLVRRVDKEAAFLAEITKEWAEERGRLIAAVKSPTYLPTVPRGNTGHVDRKPRDLHALSAVGTVGAGRPPEIEEFDGA